MNLPTKPSSLQSHQVLLYRRALHPELFTLRDRLTIRHERYELEMWLMSGAHLLRFSHQHVCACELVIDHDGPLPTEGAVTMFPCAGEHDFEYRFDPGGVNYMTSVHTETLGENLYLSTYAELAEAAPEDAFGGTSLLHRWEEPDAGMAGGRCLSRIDVQRFKREVHVQCYHMAAPSGLVLRTQTLFEHP
jgi:hypothetical protein